MQAHVKSFTLQAESSWSSTMSRECWEVPHVNATRSYWRWGVPCVVLLLPEALEHNRVVLDGLPKRLETRLPRHSTDSPSSPRCQRAGASCRWGELVLTHPEVAGRMLSTNVRWTLAVWSMW
jgi:hypothetical protein